MNLSSQSDQQLLGSYLVGDENAISTLIERHRRRVFDYINMMVKDSELADDIFQETFIKVLRFIQEGRYTDNGRFVSWVLRIAHNQVIDYFRQTKNKKKINESDAGYDILNSGLFAENSIEEKMVSNQIETDIKHLIQLLPDEQREVVKMRYYNNMSFREISESTNVSINTALGRMRYALINIRKMIREKAIILH